MPDGELEERGRDADPAKGRWSSSEMLLASVVDEVRVLQHLYVSAHVKQGQAGQPPAPVPRPGVGQGAPRRRRPRLTDEQRRMLDPRLRVIDGEAG
jgi:hypothetical protein